LKISALSTEYVIQRPSAVTDSGFSYTQQVGPAQQGLGWEVESPF